MSQSIDRKTAEKVILEIPESVLNGQRWYGAKGRQIRSRSIRDMAYIPSNDSTILLTLLDLEFKNKIVETYFLPVIIQNREEPAPEGLLYQSTSKGRAWAVSDAVYHPGFQMDLLQYFLAQSPIAGQHGVFHFQRTDVFEDVIPSADEESDPPVVLPAQQSNTLISYSDRGLFKCFRRVQPGVNPDIELSEFLTAHTEFRNIPLLGGACYYEDHKKQQWPLGSLSSFIPNEGNAWKIFTEGLKNYFGNFSAREEIMARQLQLAHRIGERTGQMHTALAAPVTMQEFLPDLIPEEITPEDWTRWAAQLDEEIAQTVAVLENHIKNIPKKFYDAAKSFLSSGPAIREKSKTILDLISSGKAGAVDCHKARFHGDYHLGQVVINMDDVFILDFEGEPLRPIEQRRAKGLVLKDIAGMLRSFNYAGFMAMTESAAKREKPPSGFDSLRAGWEQEIRDEFLMAYEQAVSEAPCRILPKSTEVVGGILALLELEKALYELRYELENRPEWVAAPLSRLVTWCDD